jgi:hypothetical protein
LDGRAFLKHKPPCLLPIHLKPSQPPSRLIGKESSTTTTRSAGLSSCHGPDACEPDTIPYCICCTAHKRLKHLQCFFRATQHLSTSLANSVLPYRTLREALLRARGTPMSVPSELELQNATQPSNYPTACMLQKCLQNCTEVLIFILKDFPTFRTSSESRERL